MFKRRQNKTNVLRLAKKMFRCILAISQHVDENILSYFPRTVASCLLACKKKLWDASYTLYVALYLLVLIFRQLLKLSLDFDFLKVVRQFSDFLLLDWLNCSPVCLINGGC